MRVKYYVNMAETSMILIMRRRLGKYAHKGIKLVNIDEEIYYPLSLDSCVRHQRIEQAYHDEGYLILK